MPEFAEKSYRIVIIGAGNVAWNLAIQFVQVGHKVVQVVGHSLESAQKLATVVGSTYTLNADEIIKDAHLYIIAVPDGSIREVAEKMPDVDGLVVHTSGSTPINVFEGNVKRYGVFYPFQTFLKERTVSLSGIPFCVEFISQEDSDLLNRLAESISAKTIEMDSETRSWLHLSGVFSCNFVNHMLAISQAIAEEAGFSFDLLKPLIGETVKKAIDKSPLVSQTGPAIRGDSETIKKHIVMLSSMSEELREMYMSISDSIWQLGHSEEL